MSDAEQQLTHEYTPDTAGGGFVMRIAREGQVTVDGRVFDKDSISWRKPPMPLMFIRANDPSGNGGHKASVAVGTITDVWRESDNDGFGVIYGRGYFSTDEEGQQAKQLIQEGVISGVSADVGGAIVEELEAETTEGGAPVLHKRIKAGEIVAVTCLPIPAFDDMKVSVTAASAPNSWKPPKDWFKNPNLSELTPLTVTADGRVYGHVAAWGTCHVGFKDRCVMAPRSNSGYQFFNVGSVLTAEGETVPVGRITAGTGHAAIEFGAQPAVAHYDNTGWAAAYVHSGEDDKGIWVAGAVSPNATEEQIATLRAASVSGDWRSINGALELVGILAVNSPGFPIPNPRAGIVAGAQVSLVAAGVVPHEEELAKGKDCGCGCGGAGTCGDEHEDADEELSVIEEECVECAKSDDPEEEIDDASEEEEDEDFEAELAEWDIEVLFPERL
jgi:hypothetical protein